MEALVFLQKSAEDLVSIESQYGVVDEEQDPLKRLNLVFYEIIYEWACGKKFVEVV